MFDRCGFRDATDHAGSSADRRNTMSSQPALFVSHGAPTLIITPGAARDFLAGLGEEIRKPRAILAVSAHWETSEPTVSLAQQPETIHDFSGFPRELYAIQYPAPGAVDLAQQVAALLSQAGFHPHTDPARGLDHGAWVPLKLMYPHADIPVTQLSVQTQRGAQHHYRIGEALRPLRDDGVLILASGSATHNLRELDWSGQAALPSWVSDFSDWVASASEHGSVDQLLRYREEAPAAARNHPTEEHFLPFFVALGAGSRPARVSRIHASTTFGVLAMDAYRFD
jgi:4,5-DOPA dioxygenase extradiol